MEAALYRTQAAGIVLLWPFLTKLFDYLDLTSTAGAVFASDAAQCRAARLCNELAGRPPDDPGMVLEKTLCGLPPEADLGPAPQFLEDEKSLMDGLLGAVIREWGALGETSNDGLRSTFLAREGRLSLAEDGEHQDLHVQDGPFDLLLDRVPWDFHHIQLRAMRMPLIVHWRSP